MSIWKRAESSSLARRYAIRVVRAECPHIDARAVDDRLRYGSFVSLKHKILYVEVPKAACTSMKMFLSRLEGAPPMKFRIAALPETRRDMFVHFRSNVPLPSLMDLDEATQQHVLTSPHFLRFCVVRNPYTRLLSAWRSKVMPCEPGYEYVYRDVMGDVPALNRKRLLSFEQFLRFVEDREDLTRCNAHWRRQVDLLVPSALRYTHVGKVEELDKTAEILRRHLHLTDPLEFARTNRSATAEIAPSDALAERIYRLYAADFQVFGYDKDSWRAASRPRVADSGTADARLMDEIVERNLVISQLHEECTLIEGRRRRAYRFSLARLHDGLGRIWKAIPTRPRVREDRAAPARIAP